MLKVLLEKVSQLRSLGRFIRACAHLGDPIRYRERLIYIEAQAICETDQNVVPGPTDRILEMVGDVEGFRGVKNVENNRGCMVDGNPRQGLFIMVSIAFPDISA
jgi:hypothetical protein